MGVNLNMMQSKSMVDGFGVKIDTMYIRVFGEFI